MRRVVVTGLGMVSPLAWGVEPTWAAILAGKSGGGRITAFDPTDYACQVACEVPRVDGRGGGGPEVPHAFDLLPAGVGGLGGVVVGLVVLGGGLVLGGRKDDRKDDRKA